MIKIHAAAAGLMGLLAVAGSAAAQAPAPASVGGLAQPAQQTGAAAGVEDGDRIVCRSVRYTGSRFPERVCKTKREMAAAREAAKNSVDRFHDRNRRNNVNDKDGAYNRQN